MISGISRPRRKHGASSQPPALRPEELTERKRTAPCDWMRSGKRSPRGPCGLGEGRPGPGPGPGEKAEQRGGHPAAFSLLEEPGLVQMFVIESGDPGRADPPPPLIPKRFHCLDTFPDPSRAADVKWDLARQALGIRSQVRNRCWCLCWTEAARAGGFGADRYGKSLRKHTKLLLAA